MKLTEVTNSRNYLLFPYTNCIKYISYVIYKSYVTQVKQIRYRFKNDAFSAVTGTSDDSSTADQAGREIINDISIQIRHYHDVELMWIGDHLHGAVIDNHRLERNPVLAKNKNIKKFCNNFL